MSLFFLPLTLLSNVDCFSFRSLYPSKPAYIGCSSNVIGRGVQYCYWRANVLQSWAPTWPNTLISWWLFRTGAKLCKIVALQEQDWTSLIKGHHNLQNSLEGRFGFAFFLLYQNQFKLYFLHHNLGGGIYHDIAKLTYLTKSALALKILCSNLDQTHKFVTL